MKKHDVMELSADASGHQKRQQESEPRACADCVNLAEKSPLTCALFCDQHGTPQLCHVQRLPGGPCGPEGVFWRSLGCASGADPHPRDNLIMFPGERRVAFPKAGTFDGGSAP